MCWLSFTELRRQVSSHPPLKGPRSGEGLNQGHSRWGRRRIWDPAQRYLPLTTLCFSDLGKGTW